MRFHSNDFDLYPARAFRPRPGGGMTLEGGKSSNVAAPDPRLVEAQIRSMGFQDDAIQQIMATSRDMLPLQTHQMQFGIDSAQSAYDQSQSDRSWMLDRRGSLSGMQDQLINDAKTFNTEDRTDQMRGQAMGDVNQAFSNSREQGARAMARMGVNPNSGRMDAMNTQTSIAQAAAMAGAGQKASAGARAEGYALTDRATNALSGYPSMSMQATGAGAGYGMAGLTAANQGLAGMNSGFGAGGQAAGQLGQNATSMFGAQANYKLGADKAAADANPLNALLGAGAQLGAASIKYSDRRLKTNIELVGRDAQTGLNLYDFEYIAEPGIRWQGVMADEVEAVMPAAIQYNESGFASVNYAMLGFEMVCLGEAQ